MVEIIDLTGQVFEHWEPEAGKCYSNLPNNKYHSLKDWDGSTDLKPTLRSVESYRHEKAQPHKNSFALERGSAVHIGIEGLIKKDDWKMFKKQVKTFPGVKIPSPKYTTVKEMYPDCCVIPVDEYQNIRIMAEKAKKKADKLNIFNNGYCELSFFWIDKTTGLRLKCRPDYLRPDIPMIFDYKTTKNHTEAGFPKEIANFLYHFQAAIYLEGVEKCTGLKFDRESAEAWSFIAIANTPPYETGFYRLKVLSLTEGEFLFRKVLKLIKAFNTEPDFCPVDVPFWAMTHLDKEY